MSDHHVIHLGSGGLVPKPCLTLETPWTVGPQAPLSMGFSRQNIGMGCHFLFQRIYPTQGLNPGLPHYRQILYRLSHQGNPTGFLLLLLDPHTGFSGDR